MEKRSPRFKRAPASTSIELTPRDHAIIRLVHRHRFLRSHHIISLLGGSAQQLTRRLQSLFHHGYLERPRAQLLYYERGGSRSIAYGLGCTGGEVLRTLGIAVDSVSWSEKNNVIGRVYLEHTLLVSDVMVSLELACRKHGGVKLLNEDELTLESKPFRWRVKLENGTRLGVIPDRVFALEYGGQRIYYFLEADRGTMPVVRHSLAQTSFFRKLLAYEATWTQRIHARLGITRFRVLTVTTSAMRVQSLVSACSELKRGQGLFLFTDTSILSGDIFSPLWQSGKNGEKVSLL